MDTPQAHPRVIRGVRRRELLKTGLAAGVTLSAWPLHTPSVLWGAEAEPPKRGGILRVRGYDPPHFDHHLTPSFKTHTTLSFIYSKLVRHQVGPQVRPGTFIVEPDLAERWEQPDDLTYIFHLRHGFCRKVRFLGQNPKIGYQKFNDIQTAKTSKKQLCDRTLQ